MKVIAINEYGNDWPIAAVKIPDGKTAEETFVAWFRAYSAQRSYAKRENWTDADIIQKAENIWQELTLIEL